MNGVRFRTCLILSVCILVVGALAPSLSAAETYRKPPDQIVKILDTPPLPFVSVNPTKTTMMLLERENLPPISEMAQPMARLAGMRLNPVTNANHGPRSVVGITLKDLKGGDERRVNLPSGAGIGSAIWSPDGEKFAFTVSRDNGTELWVGTVASASARQLMGPRLNAAGFSAFTWMPDSKRLIARMIPPRGPMPQPPSVPEGPVVQETSGRTAPVRTYQDLLENPYDEELFDYLLTSQLLIVDAETGSRRELGTPAVYSGFDPSPSGEYILVSRVEKPYSYLVTVRSFPESIEVWDTHGKVVKGLAKLPVRDTAPIGGVETGPRSHRWRSTAPATVVWVEALDGGDPNKAVEPRDALYQQPAPFTEEPTLFFRTPERYRGIQWLDDGARALVSDYERDARWAKTYLIEVDRPSAEPRVVFSRNIQDRYADKGSPVTETDARGQRVVPVHNGSVLLSGRGSSPDGDHPFLDRMSLTNFETERLFQNNGEAYETVNEILAPDGSMILTRLESLTDHPNYILRGLNSDTKTALTRFTDPAPQLRDVHKELVTYKRSDGVDLSATLYLPPGYKEGERLPLVVWAYPREFNDARTASQVSGSPYRFTSIGGSSHLFFLLEGYAIMDGATMPVVGSDPETVNDTFIDQIVASAKAAIDYAADRGVADPNRVGVGGHSYGAFMTANLLAHSDLFQAGIARSGAYNRTLTPFGFQSERRTFWQAPDIYFKLSPFMHANKVNEPILMIHGIQDNNSGTFPIQSERMYHAVKGHGGTARLVMLPNESHGYRARESVLHTLAEMIAWFEKHVKNAGSDVATGK